MEWDLPDLDTDLRRRMATEFEADVARDAVTWSTVTDRARDEEYLDAQRDAFASGDPETLAACLAGSGMFLSQQRNGARVNVAFAAKRLGGNQFNVYYTRAVAARAVDAGVDVVIYRARASASPRAESEAKIGTHLDPAALLKDLRDNSASPENFAVLPDVNSGLSVRVGS